MADQTEFPSLVALRAYAVSPVVRHVGTGTALECGGVDRASDENAFPNTGHERGTKMISNSTVFQIDPTPRKADGEYMAHARISSALDNGEQQDIYLSGDLAGFHLREDAVKFASKWAREWLENYGER